MVEQTKRTVSIHCSNALFLHSLQAHILLTCNSQDYTRNFFQRYIVIDIIPCHTSVLVLDTHLQWY